MSYAYEKDGAAIYRRSFAIIRAEARLDRFDAGDEKVAVRIIHASGMGDVADDIVFPSGFSAAATAALRAGAPILCDTQMVAHGITRARLPADNAAICTLSDPRVSALAVSLGPTRTAAAVEVWRGRRAGSPGGCRSPPPAGVGRAAHCPEHRAVPAPRVRACRPE